jgi:hypothetical protein
MKKILFTLLLFLGILFLSTGVLAQETVLLGGPEQKSSNPENSLLTTSSVLWDLSNTFTSASCTISLSDYTNTKGIQNDYNDNSRIDLNLTLNNVKIGESFSISNNTITIKAVIPSVLDAVNEEGEAQSFNIANITCNNGVKSESVTLFMQRKNELEFYKVNLLKDESSDKLRDGERINDLKSGDTVTIESEIKNLFTRSDYLDIEDIEFSARAKNELDIDEEEEFGTLSYGEKATEQLTFDIADDVNEGTHELSIKTLGNDEYGARHGQQMNFQIRIRKDNDDLKLLRVDLSPNTIYLCNSNFAAITASIENIGRNNQRKVSVVAKNDELNYVERFNDLIIDRDDYISRRFLIELPVNTMQDVYRFKLDVYNDKNKITDTREVILSVKNCSDAVISGEQQTQQSQNSISGVQSLGQLTSAQTSGGNIDIIKTSEKKESLYLTGNKTRLFLLLSVVLILLLILLLILILVR